MNVILKMLLILVVIVPLYYVSWFMYSATHVTDNLMEAMSVAGGKCAHNGKKIDCANMIDWKTYVKASVPAFIATGLLFFVLRG